MPSSQALFLHCRAPDMTAVHRHALPYSGPAASAFYCRCLTACCSCHCSPLRLAAINQKPCCPGIYCSSQQGSPCTSSPGVPSIGNEMAGLGSRAHPHDFKVSLCVCSLFILPSPGCSCAAVPPSLHRNTPAPAAESTTRVAAGCVGHSTAHHTCAAQYQVHKNACHNGHHHDAGRETDRPHTQNCCLALPL